MSKPTFRRDRRRKSGKLTYKGVAYVRPVQRGVILADLDHDPEPQWYLDDAIETLIGGYGTCEVDIIIRARRVES